MEATCLKFKKKTYGRGKPARDAICASCGVVWTKHPKTPQPISSPKPKTKYPLTKRKKHTPIIETEIAEKPAQIFDPEENCWVDIPLPKKLESEPESKSKEKSKPKRSPEEQFELERWLEQSMREFFGENCYTINDW